MTAEQLAQVPQPVRWRHVQPGQIMEQTLEDGTRAHWLIGTIAPRWDGRLAVVAITSGPDGIRQYPAPGQPDPGVDPDELANMWVPMAERDALTLLRFQLGAEGTAYAGPYAAVA